MSRAVASVALLFAAAVPPPGSVAAQDLGAPDVPFVETPMPVVETMLEAAELTPDDTLYDLGSGDGRIPILAAARYGTASVGVEIQDSLVARSRQNARRAGVQDRVRFIHGDLFETDLRPASVVTLYLLWSVNIRLRPRLLRELRAGSRIVSHQFRMGEWKPDSIVQIPDHVAHVYKWVVPADLEGSWRLRTPAGRDLTLEIDQKFQELRAVATSGGVRVPVRDASVQGVRVEIALEQQGDDGATVRRLAGTVGGDMIEGRDPSGEPWSAVRVARGDGEIDAWRDETTPDSIPAPEEPPCCPLRDSLTVGGAGSMHETAAVGPPEPAQDQTGAGPGSDVRPAPGSGKANVPGRLPDRSD